MNDQFPPPGWFMRPETWPYWMPSSLTGARMPAEPPRDVWPSHWAGKAHGGILGWRGRRTSSGPILGLRQQCLWRCRPRSGSRCCRNSIGVKTAQPRLTSFLCEMRSPGLAARRFANRRLSRGWNRRA
jgi:hypothetical protein